MSALAGWAIGLQLFTVHVGEMDAIGTHKVAPTPGIYAVAPSGFTFGAYRNSLSRTLYDPGVRVTAYAGWTWALTDAVHATAAAGTGYMRPVIPMAALSVRLADGPYAPRIMWAPQRTQPLALAWEVRF